MLPAAAAPLSRTRDDYRDLMAHISLAESPVGIDARFTHAIIIDFLRQILDRVEALERHLAPGRPAA